MEQISKKQDDNYNPHEMLDIVDELCLIAQKAGAIEKEIFENGFKAEIKADGSPVTIADKKAEEIIYESLLKLTPDIHFIGEESVADGVKTDISAGKYWLVDPLDGTKEFVGGGGEFTVNIALIENFEPVIGVIYVPMTGETYAGAGLGTGFLQKEIGSEKIKLQTNAPKSDGLVVVTSKRHGNPKKIEDFLDGYQVADMLACSSSVKFCAIARGDADIYPRLGPTCEWDTGAGDAILRAAGGHILNLEGKNLKYGKIEEKFLNPYFIACSEFILTDVVKNLNRYS